MRTEYRNGDPVGTPALDCDGCLPLNINGHLTHEAGCPCAWKDHTVACHTCGCDFYPDVRGQRVCPDCIYDEYTTITEEEDMP